MHERMGTYVKNIIEQVRTFSQANFCMDQNHDMKHCTVEELLALLQNGSNAENYYFAVGAEVMLTSNF